MSVPGEDTKLGELILLCLSGGADRDQVAQLESQLAGDEAARRYYGELLVIYAGLRQSPASLLGSAGADDATLRLLEETVEGAGWTGAATGVDEDLKPARFSQQEATGEIERYARRQLEAYLDQQRREERLNRPERREWDFADVAAWAARATGHFVARVVRAAKVSAVLAVIALTGLIVGLHFHANRVVATLADSADAVWETRPESDRLRCGWMRLEEGLAQITFKRGTEVIVQGPCEFELRSANRMFLQDGKLTARVPPRATGFTVHTPDTTVIDFGTEFGLLTGGGRADEVHVFAGQVRFKSARRRRARRWEQSLTKGQAATVDTTGQVQVQAVKERPVQFVRTLEETNEPGQPAGQLDLADMVGGGDGCGRGSLGRGIDPSTGRTVSTDSVSRVRGSGYLETPALGFIDGVFVPDGGDGPFRVSSAGTTFSGFPDTSGTCYRTILNGAVFRAMPSPVHAGRLSDGEAHEGPSIGMHASAGITFDLDRIRQVRPHVDVAAFRALCGVSETVAEFASPGGAPRGVVEFWVLVDGQRRFSAKLKPVPAESKWIDVPLSAEDRFLTLATTGANDCTFCWGMFVEPTLELRTK